MEEFKRMTVWDLLIFLQGKVKHNASTIRHNADTINKVDSQLKASPELIQTIHKLTRQSDSLTRENTKFLNLFNVLVDFHKSYKISLQGSIENIYHIDTDESVDSHNFDDYLKKTLSGEIQLDHNHPLITDKTFLLKLLELWERAEEYEKCSIVKELLSVLGR